MRTNFFIKLFNRLAHGWLPQVWRLAHWRWNNYPFTSRPMLRLGDYDRFASATFDQVYRSHSVAEFEESCGTSIDAEWLKTLADSTQIVIKESQLDYNHGRVLYSQFCKYIATHPEVATFTFFETGTARGFSSVCMARALSDMGRDGRIISIDVLPHRVKMYWNSRSDHTRGPITRQQLLDDWAAYLDKIIFVQGPTKLMLPAIQVDRIHQAFIDGAHDAASVSEEFEQISRLQESGDSIVFDDYNDIKFPELVAAVDSGCECHGYLQIKVLMLGERACLIATKK